MDLKSYYRIVWKHKLIVAATVVVVVAVVVVGTLLTAPTYSATTLLRVATAKSGTFDQIRYDLDYTDRLVNTYLRLATGRIVRDELRRRLNVALVPNITAEAVAKSELIQLTADSSDPELAANTVSALTQILIEQVNAEDPSYVSSLGVQVKQAKDVLDQALKDYETALNEYGLSSRLISNILVGSTSSTRTLTLTLPYTEVLQYAASLPYTVTYPYTTVHPSTGFFPYTVTTYVMTTFDPTTAPVQVAARNLDAQQSIYASLLRQYDQAQATDVLLTQGLSVVEPAIVPTTPVSPRVAVNVLLALVVGLAAGLGLAFLVENWQSG